MRRLAPLVLLVFAAAGIATTAISVAATTDRGGPGRGFGGKRQFVVQCQFSHRNTDDLIVFPGQAGRSHDHTYFGNKTTNASSTLESLRAANATTCFRRGDTAAYWVPTLFSNGQAVTPRSATIYYRRRTVDRVQAFPPGFRMIAGTATATAAQPLQVTFWNCKSFFERSERTSTMPTCASSTAGRSTLNLHVNFPNCWDGTSLDSADHKSHLAYAAGGRCPATHPVAVPAISLIVHYAPVNPATAELASRGQFSGHGDFVNAWNQEKLQRLVDRYLNRIRRR
jgi:Domain of unknown function (DUF1996)